jgi:lipopolysaccharide transport system permease protein
MVTNANIIKKIYFPRLIIPLSSILVSIFDFFMTLIVFIGVIIYFSLKSEIHVNWIYFVVLLPICVVLTCLASFGLGALLAAMNIKYRDFRYLIPFLVQTLLFLTPVIYPLNIVESETIRFILALNPLYSAIELFRAGLTGVFPEMYLVITSIISSLVILVAGVYFFRKTEYYFADLA